MRIYRSIQEKSDILPYLESRHLVHQYKQAKIKILAGYRGKLDFKERRPKGSGIFSFRINQQFRAFCIEKDDGLIVFEINNHQDF